MKKNYFLVFFILIPFFKDLCLLGYKNSSIDPLKILVYVPHFPSKTQFFVLNQIVGFIKAGHDVTILTPIIDRDSINASHPDIIKYQLLDRATDKLSNDQNEFDIILCEFAYLVPHLIALKKKRNLHGKLFVFYRGPSFTNKQLRKRAKEIFNASDLFLPVSNDFKRDLLELGCDPRKIKVVHSAVDCKEFLFKNRWRGLQEIVNITTVARLIPKKGVEDSIRAVKKLVNIHPKIRYRIVGDGPLRKKLEKLIKDLGLQEIVTLLGWQTPAEVKQILYESHIFLLSPKVSSSGNKEGIPNALMEAMATGLPTVTTFHGGCPELIVNRRSGFLVREEDINSIARRIDFLITHPRICIAMGRCGRKIIEKSFNKDKENRRLIDLCLANR